jgi:ribosomal-protein-alanine N-acetyltransferase
MNTPDIFSTARLSLAPLGLQHSPFIMELVNTPGWITFIGNRNVHSAADATAYIGRIINNPKIKYWVVNLNDSNIPIGIITFIKRDYLHAPDIGFAFLPQYSGNGYAYEAAHTVLQQLLQHNNNTHILATTIPSNEHSIRLLTKLGLRFDKEIEVEKEKLHVYAIAV